MKILVLNGPNLNMLGKRDQKNYGTITLQRINDMLTDVAKKHDITLLFFQSNHEGALIDFLQKESQKADGILINAGALTHYSHSLRDALTDTKLPVVSVHLSDIQNREDFRKVDVLKDIAIKVVLGLKETSYTQGLEILIDHLKKGAP